MGTITLDAKLASYYNYLELRNTRGALKTLEEGAALTVLEELLYRRLSCCVAPCC